MRLAYSHFPINVTIEGGGKYCEIRNFLGEKIVRLAYSHFPINVTIEGGGKYCEIRNFLGEKIVRRIDMLGDTKVSKTDTKDEIQVEGTDIELVGRSCALINQSCAVKKKDIRKFLDGIYVSAYGAGDEMKSKI